MSPGPFTPASAHPRHGYVAKDAYPVGGAWQCGNLRGLHPKVLNMETPEVRRRTMQAVKSENTGPELAVQRLVHSMGYRFRLHRKDLPGKPDLAFPSLRKAIFVHGCFWHGHDCARGARVPVQNRAYWTKKIAGNKARDKDVQAALTAVGWHVLTLRECEIRQKQPEELAARIQYFLDGCGEDRAGHC